MNMSSDKGNCSAQTPSIPGVAPKASQPGPSHWKGVLSFQDESLQGIYEDPSPAKKHAKQLFGLPSETWLSMI